MDILSNKFKTATGKEYTCPFFSTLPNLGLAYVAVSDLSWAEASALFGYTHLDYIMSEPYGLKAQLSIPR